MQPQGCSIHECHSIQRATLMLHYITFPSEHIHSYANGCHSQNYPLHQDCRETKPEWHRGRRA